MGYYAKAMKPRECPSHIEEKTREAMS